MICFVCARICLRTKSTRTDIEYQTGEWLRSLVAEALQKNFSQAIFLERYGAVGELELQEWRVQMEEETGVVREAYWICCPENHECIRNCQLRKTLCDQCRVPICTTCPHALTRN